MTQHTAYIEHADTISVSGYDVPAALTLPGEQSDEVPCSILLIPGSLFSDVNGDYPTWQSFPHVYAHLARQLSELGHAVYRYAKLGPGTGSVVTDADRASQVRNWDGRLGIASAALDAMHRALDARGVKAHRVIAAGHSEGSVVVSRLAVSSRGDELDGVVLLAGPSVGILEIMREQGGQMTPESERTEAARRLDEAIAYVRRGERPPSELAAGNAFGAGAPVSMPDDGLRYMRDVDATDPLAVARTMRQPVLVVQGGADSSVPTHHGERLRDALIARAGGAARTTYQFFPEISHMFKIVPADVTGPAAFGFPGDTDRRVTAAIDAWIRDLPASDAYRALGGDVRDASAVSAFRAASRRPSS